MSKLGAAGGWAVSWPSKVHSDHQVRCAELLNSKALSAPQRHSGCRSEGRSSCDLILWKTARQERMWQAAGDCARRAFFLQSSTPMLLPPVWGVFSRDQQDSPRGAFGLHVSLVPRPCNPNRAMQFAISVLKAKVKASSSRPAGRSACLGSQGGHGRLGGMIGGRTGDS